MELDLHAVRQINGDLRIDDEDEGPMMTIQFFDTWATTLTDEDKDEILGAALVQVTKIMTEREDKILLDQNGSLIPDRRGAIAHTKAKPA